MGSITHTFQSEIADDPVAEAAGEVTPGRWNAAHTFSLTTADIPDSSDKRYVTDAQLALIPSGSYVAGYATPTGRVPFTVTGGAVYSLAVCDPTRFGTHSLLTLLSSDGRTATVDNPDDAGRVRSSISHVSGKWYAEFVISDDGGDNGYNIDIGFCSHSYDCTLDGEQSELNDSSIKCWMGRNGTPQDLARTLPFIDMPNGVVGVAVDIDAGKIWYRPGGTWIGDPAAGTGQVFGPATTGVLPAGIELFLSATFYGLVSGSTVEIVTRSADFTYSIPSGFSAWS